MSFQNTIAAITGASSLLEPFNVADVETMIRVNLLGVVYAIEAVLPDRVLAHALGRYENKKKPVTSAKDQELPIP